ncbi:hypothetical protein [Nocardioides sp. LML1-1-1.1]|uniref:hypothetical protein n=1 Tax=Nocardioides sp. LML1-1-1.1 TaxID=3135248 RepID=UPI00342A7D72
MPIELTSAALLVAVAFLCVAFLARGREQVVVLPAAAPSADEWRSAALHHFHEHKDLRRSVAEALSTPGAVSGEARRELMVALGAPRVDVMA